MNTAAQPSFSLADRFTRQDGAIYLTGMQALARLLIDQHRADARRGLRTAGLVSGYPGSPLGGFDIELGRQHSILSENHIQLLPGLNEDLAATALWGSQMLQVVGKAKYDGVFGMWFGKAPGVDRSGDALRHGNIRGVAEHGGVLAVVGDDPHPVSSMFPSDSNVAFYDFQMPLLYPGDVQDILDLGLHGYALSRAAGVWVGFKIVSSVADSAGTAIVGTDRIVPRIPLVEIDGKPFKAVLRMNEAGAPMREAERDLYYARLEIARRYSYENALNKVAVDSPSARLGIVAPGKTYFDVRQALRDLGLDARELERLGIRILNVRQLYPIDPRTIRDFAEDLEEILVVEEKRPFLETFIRDILYTSASRPVVVGKNDENGQTLLRAFGELDADTVARAIAARLLRRFDLPSVRQRLDYLDRSVRPPIQLSTGRAPYFCSGCPHSRSLVTPDDTIVGAGIGCHVMALYMGKENFGKVIGYTQMGGEGAQFAGLAPFTEHKHFVQNLGDGTFAHSGSLAIRFAIASGANVTYKLLYNQAISMTGGQNIMGAMSVPALTQMLTAEGAARVVVTTDDPARYRGVSLAPGTTVRHRDEILDVERELAVIPGVTVMLHDQQCAAEKRRLRKRNKLATPDKTVVINERVCEGCGDCGRKSNCLSVQPVETEFGRKTKIEQSSCNKDFSCMLGDCPSFLTVEGQVAKAAVKKALPSIGADLPRPQTLSSAADFGMRMCGIGGTGVVTVNQILCTAGVLDGYEVRSLDLTGFSQKAGPVASEIQLFRGDAQRANTLSTGGADLYLVFDPLVGVDSVHLAKADPDRTVAVMSISKVPTGRMVADINTLYPDQSLLRRRIESATRAKDNVYVDAQRIAASLIGDHMAGNMILVGAAYQTGRLPVTDKAVEEAIRVNGTAVDMNIAAFRLGRLAVAKPDRVEEMIESATKVSEPAPRSSERARQIVATTKATGELARVLEIRVAELDAYQNAAYAEDYATFVAQVAEIEQRVTPGKSDLALAVARYLYKFMAYKDEYEVARLLLAQKDSKQIESAFGDQARVYWHVHPSFLRRLGVRNKVRLGAWFAPGLKLLRALKGLRGGRLDFFGRGDLRKRERALIGEYRQQIEAATRVLTADNHGTVVALASLPDVVRGYEDVKMGTLRTYDSKVRELKQQLGLLPQRASSTDKAAVTVAA
jgi:indolepyruvate ferredoxin oxidoreductase